MTRKLITFLGTGKYEKCEYHLDHLFALPTKYIQEAIVDLYLKMDKPIDEVHILLTPEAKEKHWLVEEGLSSRLQNYENRGLIIKTHDISSDQNIENIWKLFDTIVNRMEKDDLIVFDITHSFRFQPMLALLSLHFARVTKQVKIDGIYYGLYDPNKEPKVFPIIDLTSFTDMQDWITNVYAFTKTGRVEGLTEWIKEKEQTIRREERKTTPDLKNIRKLAERWQELMAALQTNRSKDLPEKAREALQSIESLKDENIMLRPAFLPINELLTKVENDIRDIAKDDLIFSGLSAIEWCQKHGLYQQAYTMAEELVVTTVCIKYNIDYEDKDSRIHVARTITAAIKTKDEKNTEFINNESVNKEIALHLLKFPKLLEKQKTIIDNRNDINHAGWKTERLSSVKLVKHFDKLYDELKEQLIKFYESPLEN